MLNTLRQEGILTPISTGWRWDEPAVRSLLASSDVAARPIGRLAALPPASRDMVEMMACLGGRAELGVLAAATGESADVVERLLAPALEEGVLVAETGAHDGVRFRHDRIREAVLAELDVGQRRSLQLGLARRLAAAPELFAVAAEQYLPVIDAVTDAAERLTCWRCCGAPPSRPHSSAGTARFTRCSPARCGLPTQRDAATLIELHTGRLTALFCLGRLEEADEDYRIVERLSTTVMQRVDATAYRCASLTNRKLYPRRSSSPWRRCASWALPSQPLTGYRNCSSDYFDYLYRWLDHTDAADDLARPEITDPTLLAVTCLLSAVFPTATFAGDTFMQAWLSLEAVRILLDHGTARGMLGPASYSAVTAIALRDDYGAAYRASSRILTMAEARGYEPETVIGAVCGLLLQLLVRAAGSQYPTSKAGPRRADQRWRPGHRRLHRGPHLRGATGLRAKLDVYLAEADEPWPSSSESASNRWPSGWQAYRWLADVLRGETPAASGEAAPIDWYAEIPAVPFYGHFSRAIAAAIFDDPASLRRSHRRGDGVAALCPRQLRDRGGPPASGPGPRRGRPNRCR